MGGGCESGMERLEGLKDSELEISKSLGLAAGLDVSIFDLFHSGTSLGGSSHNLTWTKSVELVLEDQYSLSV